MKFEFWELKSEFDQTFHATIKMMSDRNNPYLDNFSRLLVKLILGISSYSATLCVTQEGDISIFLQ